MDYKEPETPAEDDGTATGGATQTEFVGPIEAVKRVALASLGAVAVATEASDEVFHTLLKKGEEARDEARREIREARLRAAERRAESQTFVQNRVDSLLNHVNLASKGDVDALNAKLNIITRKLDEFQAARGANRQSEEGRADDVNLN